MTAFSGFPKETFDFLYALTNNNSKIRHSTAPKMLIQNAD